MTVTTPRPRVSDEFLKANTRSRVIAGTSKAIAERGYCAVTVADIVKACRTARNTFYDCFGGKEQAALALVADLGPEVEALLGPSASLNVLLIELAAAAHAMSAGRGAEAERWFRFFANCDLISLPAEDDPRQQSLPPGRHNLPAKFRAENQRTRLLSGCAVAIAAWGLSGTTVKDVCAEASVSRRTLCEHFQSLEDLARAMVLNAVPSSTGFKAEPRSGIGLVAIEIVAERIVDGHSPLAEKALAAMETMAEAVSA